MGTFQNSNMHQSSYFNGYWPITPLKICCVSARVCRVRETERYGSSLVGPFELNRLNGSCQTKSGAPTSLAIELGKMHEYLHGNVWINKRKYRVSLISEKKHHYSITSVASNNYRITVSAAWYLR